MISTIWKYFKPSKKMLIERVIVTKDSRWVSNGFIAYNRKFYYSPHMERVLDTVEVGSRNLSEVDRENLEKLHDKDLVEANLLEMNVNLSHLNMPTVKVYAESKEFETFNAKYIGSLFGYLKDEYKEHKVELYLPHDATGKEPLVAKVLGEVVAIVMPVNDL